MINIEIDIMVVLTAASLVWAGGWSFFRLLANMRRGGSR